MMSQLVAIASLSLLLFSCEQRDGSESHEILTLFTDVAQESGLSFIHESGAAGEFLLPEIMAGGAGFFDYDGDGYLDIYLVQSGHMGSPDSKLANRLYRNTYAPAHNNLGLNLLEVGRIDKALQGNLI